MQNSGGTSVANYDAMQKSAGRSARPRVALVVLSASAGITNALIELAQGCLRAQREKCLKQVRDTNNMKSCPVCRENAAVHNEIDHLLGNKYHHFIGCSGTGNLQRSGG